MLWVDVFLGGWRTLLRGLVVCDGIVGWLGELSGCFLLGEGVERWRAGWLGLRTGKRGGKGVVGAGLGWF